jgi:branched-chain amino acid transport system permease protein
LLFLLSSGLTLIYSMMGVPNFAHASFYMLGAYVAYALAGVLGFWWALLLAPLMVGVAGALVEHYGLRIVHRYGHAGTVVHVRPVLSGGGTGATGLGRSPVPYRIPPELDGTLFTLYSTAFPVYRGFMLLVAALMLLACGCCCAIPASAC